MGYVNVTRETETLETINEDGTSTKTIKERTLKRQRIEEPNFIKLYTNMWCEFNQIPVKWRALFFELVGRMTYCNSYDLDNSQLVNTGKPWNISIMKALDIQKRQYQQGLKELCDCGAIRKVAKGVYQVNPSYAGKGEWKYNPKYERGGIEDLVATFKFKAGDVETQILWADNGANTEFNQDYRDGLDVGAGDGTVLKTFDIVQPQADQAETDKAV